MHFAHLDASGSSVPVYTVGWRVVDQPDDLWTSRFLKFKAGRRGFVLGGAAIMREALKELIALHEWEPGMVAVSTALSSGKTSADPKSVLYNVGKWVSAQVGAKWVPDLFEKDAHRSLHSLHGGHERDAEVSGKYRCTGLEGADVLVVLDDFVTRGATFGDMKRALSAVCPGVPLVGLALGKNEKASWAAGWGRTVDNSHIPPAWNDLFEEFRGKVA